MPIISQFYGIVIQMFFDENGKHHEKHIHIKYNEYSCKEYYLKNKKSWLRLGYTFIKKN